MDDPQKLERILLEILNKINALEKAFEKEQVNNSKKLDQISFNLKSLKKIIQDQ